MTPSTQTMPGQDGKAQWSRALLLYPIYQELAREFAIEMPPCAPLQAGQDAADEANLLAAQEWLQVLDGKIEVHQLRQFLQTSSAVHGEGLLALIQHFVGQSERTAAVRDKLDFLLVQHFSQNAPSQLEDASVDIAYVAESLEAIVGKFELKSPLWLNGLDRVLESARKCRSLDELLHGGVLDQGRKAKGQAGDLFYLPIALVAFTRYGYLMRRAFFRLMHSDLNGILEGLGELEAQGLEAIDCRRAQFSQAEPIGRLRIICQSWKVMFQAEYSSGQPLRMLVDLRASVDFALGKGSDAGGIVEESEGKLPEAAPAVVAKRSAAAAGAGVAASWGNHAEKIATPAVSEDAPEFDVSPAPEWDAQEEKPQKKGK